MVTTTELDENIEINTPNTYNKADNEHELVDNSYQGDKKRQKWSSTSVFPAACLMNSFGVINFSLLPTSLMVNGGVVFLIPYALGLILFSLPVFCLQTFLGQFTGTGLISAYRFAPLYKAVGYFMLVFNLITASCYAVFAAIPLVYVFSVYNSSAPWLKCGNEFNTFDCHLDSENSTEFDHSYTFTGSQFSYSVVEFLHLAVDSPGDNSYTNNGRLIFSLLAVWCIVAIIISSQIEFIGKLLKLFHYLIFISLIIILIRLLLLPGSVKALGLFLKPRIHNINLMSLITSPILSILAFSSGWGTILTLSSYNQFKENIQKLSLTVFLYHISVIFCCSLCLILAKYHAEYYYQFDINDILQYDLIYSTYYIFPYVFGKIEGKTMWTILLCLILFMGELSTCIIQLLSITTGLFDEHLILRQHKKKCTIAMMLIVVFLSGAYLVNNGIYLMLLSVALTGALQMLICFVELIVIGWCGGQNTRIQLQQDIKFMIGKPLQNWKLFILYYISPIMAILAACVYFMAFGFGCLEFPATKTIHFVIMLILKLTPILIIPIYIIYKIYQVPEGTFLQKWRQLNQKTDWCPTDLVQREKYNDLIGNLDISHELLERNQKSVEI